MEQSLVSILITIISGHQGAGHLLDVTFKINWFKDWAALILNVIQIQVNLK